MLSVAASALLPSGAAATGSVLELAAAGGPCCSHSACSRVQNVSCAPCVCSDACCDYHSDITAEPCDRPPALAAHRHRHCCMPADPAALLLSATVCTALPAHSGANICAACGLSSCAATLTALFCCVRQHRQSLQDCHLYVSTKRTCSVGHLVPEARRCQMMPRPAYVQRSDTAYRLNMHTRTATHVTLSCWYA